jgi:hypothetical protein
MDEKERSKLRRKLRKLNGRCQNCGKLNSEIHGPTCTECRSLMRSYISKKRADNPLTCVICHQPKAGNSKIYCDSCLGKMKIRSFIRRNSQYGRWANRVRSDSVTVAKGSNGRANVFTSHLLPWTHQDFCKAFPAHKESGKQIDHIIPLACAESSPGQLDEEFAKLVVRLENLQLLTSSENNKKAFNIERQIKARAIALRQQGKHGAELFHQLWAEFAYPQRQEEGNQDALPND